MTDETKDNEEEVEGHVRNPPHLDPDFASRQPSVHPAESADEDDVEGHAKNGGR